uniref:Protein BZR1 homolog n=1 Tax=Kalanchoe fedtschenkoi TaxID=63787 RepID=A0A7N0T423_KALFE
MPSGPRLPTWRERENNKRRERRRRAIAAKIYAGLRTYGNYQLPKHCDNNEVLKALCNEAGWIVEEDGTTYRKGCKPTERMDMIGGSASVSPCSSYQPSPCASHNPSPPSSSFPSPSRTPTNTNGKRDADSLIPWLKNLSSGTPSASSELLHRHLQMRRGRGSISAPITPPLSSPTCRTPIMRLDWENGNPGGGSVQPSFFTSSTQATGAQNQMLPETWIAGFQISQAPTSPTFSLVSRNPFDIRPEIPNPSGSRMWTPGQSGACSPAIPAGHDRTADVPMSDAMASEFAFGDNSNGLVKAWEGERIHEESGSDDLELKL